MGEGLWVGPRPLQPQKTGVSFFLFNKSSSGDNDRGERRIFEPHFHKSVSTRALSHAAPPPETRATPLFVTQWSCADDGIGLLSVPPVPDGRHPPSSSRCCHCSRASTASSSPPPLTSGAVRPFCRTSTRERKMGTTLASRSTTLEETDVLGRCECSFMRSMN